MRIILDTNIFLSYLLARRPQGALVQAVERCLTDNSIQLVLPQELLSELRQAVAQKEYLETHITISRLELFIQQLMEVAEIPPILSETSTGLSRDPKDDYLLAYGLVEDVDYLITGDKDLLILKQTEQLTILRVQDFFTILTPRIEG